jgi:hypothetical protein
MLVGRCSWELSGRKPQRKIKKSQTPSEAEAWEPGKECSMRSLMDSGPKRVIVKVLGVE